MASNEFNFLIIFYPSQHNLSFGLSLTHRHTHRQYIYIYLLYIHVCALPFLSWYICFFFESFTAFREHVKFFPFFLEQASLFPDRWHAVNELLFAGFYCQLSHSHRNSTIWWIRVYFQMSVLLEGVQQRVTREMDKRHVWQLLLAVFCHFNFIRRYNKNKKDRQEWEAGSHNVSRLFVRIC